MSGIGCHFSKIYSPAARTYPALLRHLFNLNALLSEHLPAPNEVSKVNTQRLYDAIGRPLDRIPSILVGGTNGKGSTCLKLATGLQVSGLKTGLFVSPHISSYRERVQVNSKIIEEEEVLIMMPKLMDICLQHEIPATFFELTFALACLKFEAAGCDAVVLEVGVGGEWDATNVVVAALSIVCSVDLDHVRFLGPTIADIARNKAGIFKENRPALIGPGCPQDILIEEARKRNCILFSLSDPFLLSGVEESDSSGDVFSTASVPESEIAYADKLNTKLAYAGLKLLHYAAVCRDPDNRDIISRLNINNTDLYSRFSCLNLSNIQLKAALGITAPCRWQRITRPICISERKMEDRSLLNPSTVNVEVILDIAHNPAAIYALMRRAKQELDGKRVRLGRL